MIGGVRSAPTRGLVEGNTRRKRSPPSAGIAGSSDNSTSRVVMAVCSSTGGPSRAVHGDCRGLHEHRARVRWWGGDVLSRPDEPSVFRRCHFGVWIGGATRPGLTCGASIQRRRNTRTCCSRIARSSGPTTRCRPAIPATAASRGQTEALPTGHLQLLQPQGKPGTGVIYSTIEGRLLHVTWKIAR